MNEKTCLECGHVLVGRRDKKFCDDHCRSTYNNRKNAEANEHIRNIISILKHNRTILSQLCPEGKKKVKRDVLSQAGFHFQYHTHIYETKEKNIYTFCFDYGYLALDDEYVLIVHRTQPR